MTASVGVGVDGSEASAAALSWAAEAAALRGAALLVVVARPPLADWPHDSAEHVTELTARIDEHIAVIRRLVDEVLSTTEGLAWSVEVIEGHPAQVLAAVCARVDLLAIGSRGLSEWEGALAGSVSGQLAGHTAVPLAVIRQRPAAPHGRIVVGVDGPKSVGALRFALAEAALRGASLLAVSTWRYPAVGAADATNELAELYELGAAEELETALAVVRGDHPQVTVEPLVEMGHPVEVLDRHAEAADLVVVGSRGRGGFATLLLGSVAIAVLHRVASPVVVVPPLR